MGTGTIGVLLLGGAGLGTAVWVLCKIDKILITVMEALADASAHKISDQLGHSKINMIQDRYLGRRLTDRQTADVLEKLLESGGG